VADVISKADPVCTISGYDDVYDGDAHGASGSCSGVEDEVLDGLDLGASFTNVPGGTADWTFTDVTGNYNDDSGSVASSSPRLIRCARSAATTTCMTVRLMERRFVLRRRR